MVSQRNTQQRLSAKPISFSRLRMLSEVYGTTEGHLFDQLIARQFAYAKSKGLFEQHIEKLSDTDTEEVAIDEDG